MRPKLPPIRYSLLARLLFAYIVVTFFAWGISSMLIGLYEYSRLRRDFEPARIAARNLAEITEIAPLLAVSTRNPAALDLWLEKFNNEVVNERRRRAPSIYINYEKVFPNEDFLAFFDTQGNLLAKNTGQNETLSAPERKLLEDAGKDVFPTDFSLKTADAVTTIVPVKSSNGETVGLFLARSRLFLTWKQAIYKLAWNWSDTFGTMIFMFVGTGVVFSYFLGRGLTRRLRRISEVAGAWSSGDFKARTVDDSDDEIWLLARRLNSMAKDLNEFFLLKQRLAAATERNKIARELHDSVKQQIFALSMQLGAANLLANQANGQRTENAAAAHLLEAENLARSVQNELVDLINELRPPDQHGETLAARIESFITDWKRQNRIAVNLSIGALPFLPLHTEHMLFRIVQEAFANIARHSEARKVALIIEKLGGEKLRLSIRDDGKGFNPAEIKKGLGLTNMRERAELLPQGAFDIATAKGAGTEIIIVCNINQNDEDEFTS